MTCPLELQSETLKMTFDLRWNLGGLMAIDWRDAPHNHNMGPSLSAAADGWLSANGKKLLQLPDTEPPVFEGVTCSPQFSALNCIVFMAATFKRADDPGAVSTPYH